PAQSPNTGSIVVNVVDAHGASVSGAVISVTDTSTAAVRTATADSEGAASFAGLSINGNYSIKVREKGFGDAVQNDIHLRAGETAAIKVALAVGGTDPIPEITVYGTADGVRNDPQIGRSIDSATMEQTPVLGRKLT